ncbi:MAG: 1-(5-phosphoribosyl)-5-[(5-phosphoribosylamino)methylideneamino]imidazole-4-carboxamide isomerase [Alphaproteobacteria bacterium]|nr:1-(5-phosphoribosyl)-5-[(5-phosphoribosylamino)methylideneamino]imidazole-4-carboxamide isomerase [Alphaproteobacteria bacterium]
MRLYPAIDLKDGKCVRLFKGDMAQATIYGENPAEQAAEFEAAGFKYLHVVDLNGAIEGQSVNKKPVEAMLERLTIPVQLGGGIRTRAQVEAWLEAGIARVILGTIALKNPSFVRELARAFPKQIVVGIDAKGGMVAVEGWVNTSQMRAVDLARAFEDAGVASIIYTDIGRDGTLSGPNLEETAALAKSVRIPVIVSGGVSGNHDIEAAAKMDCFEGIIIGKALYEKKIDLKALKIA